VTSKVDGNEPTRSITTRSHVQVLANSLSGTVLTVIHYYSTHGDQCFSPIPRVHESHESFISNLLIYGIIGYISEIPG
jgi:hypothetical protein